MAVDPVIHWLAAAVRLLQNRVAQLESPSRCMVISLADALAGEHACRDLESDVEKLGEKEVVKTRVPVRKDVPEQLKVVDSTDVSCKNEDAATTATEQFWGQSTIPPIVPVDKCVSFQSCDVGRLLESKSPDCVVEVCCGEI